jgi:hypothetical protein
MDATVTGMIP